MDANSYLRNHALPRDHVGTTVFAGSHGWATFSTIEECEVFMDLVRDDFPHTAYGTVMQIDESTLTVRWRIGNSD